MYSYNILDMLCSSKIANMGGFEKEINILNHTLVTSLAKEIVLISKGGVVKKIFIGKDYDKN